MKNTTKNTNKHEKETQTSPKYAKPRQPSLALFPTKLVKTQPSTLNIETSLSSLPVTTAVRSIQGERKWLQW